VDHGAAHDREESVNDLLDTLKQCVERVDAALGWDVLGGATVQDVVAGPGSWESTRFRSGALSL
jgi:hypothetical protein